MRYFYKAKNLKGKEKSGILAAESSTHLARILREKGYFLISSRVEEEVKKKGKLEFSKLNIFEKLIGVSLTEKLFFTKNLEVMIRTGIPLPRAFEILSTQAKSKKFKRALQVISEKIIKGENLSDSLAVFPEIFSALYQETLRIGEETGKLEDSLRILSLQMEREYSLKSKIKTAMVYPILVLSMAAMIGILMMIVVVPKLKAAFEELNIALPLTTRIILSFADFLTKKWPLVVLTVAFLSFILIMLLRSEKGGKLKSKLSLKIPIVSKIVKQTNSALALRTLSSLLKAGVPIVRSLEVAAGALTNFYFKKSLKEAAKIVEKGKKVSEALASYQSLYSPMVLQMMEVGEETGETAGVLEKLADFYEEEVAESTQKLSAIIEPVLIMIVGGVVGFFAISMMQPLFSVMGGM